MGALTADRNTKRKDGKLIGKKVALTTTIFAGSLVMTKADGYAVPGADTASCRCCGVADEKINNSAGADGDLSVNCWHEGLHYFANSSGHALDQSHVGSVCYIEDDQTVASSSSNSVAAGIVEAVDAGGVWVRVPGDEATLAALGAAKGRIKIVHQHDPYGGAAYGTDLTAAATGEIAFVATRAGKITNLVGRVSECGADGTDDLHLEFDVNIGGVSALTTKAKIDQTAGATAANTGAAGSGITQAVIDAAHNTYAAGDEITIDYDLERTTPEDEMAGPMAVIECEELINS